VSFGKVLWVYEESKLGYESWGISSLGRVQKTPCTYIGILVPLLIQWYTVGSSTT